MSELPGAIPDTSKWPKPLEEPKPPKCWYEIWDHNIIPDHYVVYVVEMRNLKNREDPACSIVVAQGTWKAEDLEKDGVAFDPDFSQFGLPRDSSYYYHRFDGPKPEPLQFHKLEQIKSPDREALQYAEESNTMLNPEAYVPYELRKAQGLYIAFMAAIDKLHENYEDPEAWKAIEAWRQYQALKHEK